ncbi:hypothetical protein WN944_026068 [Citrus x changshan-huyou]|uniref:Cullin N-terminal domain-containing protein n=1 Tax=Citrus x changshan-huyou TaxID=2935761 RepID=A0AAP0LVM3_9ROSI
MKQKAIDSEEGWDYLDRGITKLKRIFEGLPEPAFNLEDYMMLYTTVYNIYSQSTYPLDKNSKQLYNNYKQILEDYMPSKVLPSLREKHDEYDLLKELLKSWANHKFLVKWLSLVFLPLQVEFAYITRKKLPKLNAFGLSCFRDLVFDPIKDKVKDAVIALIDREREGEEIDRTLVKNVLNLFVEIDEGKMHCYEKDFEEHMLQDTGAYYSRKASNWILQDSSEDYMLKVGECLKKERGRASHYLQPSSERKLTDILEHELLVVRASQLLEEGEFGCRQLPRGDKVDDHSIICCDSEKSRNELGIGETLE